jgi:phosphopentomutase
MKKGEVFNRVVLLVLDSAGIGEMPDADQYDDQGSDTLGHVFAHRPVNVPNLRRYGIANIKPAALSPVETPDGAFGRAAIASNGKDTTTGHWEMAGLLTDVPFPTYPNGFPPELIEAFENAIGRKTLGNKPASGTEIIKELGEEHITTGSPIVYTSADSVFQIAAHESVIPLPELYRMCEIARRLLARSSARPASSSEPKPDAITRLSRRSRRCSTF